MIFNATTLRFIEVSKELSKITTHIFGVFLHATQQSSWNDYINHSDLFDIVRGA